MRDTFLKLVAILVGFVITCIAGKFVQCILKYVGEENVPQELRRKDDGGGKIVGKLERIFFFSSLWLEAYVAIGGFLTLKAASKWAAWQHIVKVPDSFQDGDPKKSLESRNAAGSYLYSRFLLGTLYNWLCGVLGVVIGKGCFALLAEYCK